MGAVLKASTKSVRELEVLLEKTKAEIADTEGNLTQLSVANTVILGLREKVSVLLLQMSTTFERVVKKRIEDAGFETINVQQILDAFPKDIRTIEGETFENLDKSVNNLTTYCGEASNAEDLSKLQNHADIADFCTILMKYPPTEIGGQLQQAVQEHINEYREWFTQTAESYKKFHQLMIPGELKEQDDFEPLGFQE